MVTGRVEMRDLSFTARGVGGGGARWSAELITETVAMEGHDEMTMRETIRTMTTTKYEVKDEEERAAE